MGLGNSAVLLFTQRRKEAILSLSVFATQTLVQVMDLLCYHAYLHRYGVEARGQHRVFFKLMSTLP